MAATTNVFELLGDGDDGVEQLAAKIPAPTKESKPAEPAKPSTPVKKEAPGPARMEGGRGGRGGRGAPPEGGRGGRGGFGRGGPARAPSGEAPLEGLPEDGKETRRPISGRDRGRGGRDGIGHREPRRPYERRDGTGRGHELQKRGGAGVGNWGTDTDVKPDAEPAVVAADEAEPVVESGAAAPADGAHAGDVTPAAEAPAPEPEKEMTLEEYEKQQAEKRAALNKVAEVKSIAVEEEFKGMKAYVRKEPEETLPGIEISKRKESGKLKGTNSGLEEASSTTPKDKPKKQVLETGFKLGESSDAVPRGRSARGEGRGGARGGGDRPFGSDRPFSSRGGGRGGDRPFSARGPGPYGGRGAGGRGGGRGAELPINDEGAFPSLG